MAILDDVLSRYDSGGSTSLLNQKIDSVNGAYAQKEEAIYEPVMIESMEDADTLSLVGGNVLGDRQQGYDAYETYHGPLDDSNDRYWKEDGTQDTDKYNSDINRLERQRRRYAKQFNVSLDNVTYADIHEEGAKEALRSLDALTREEGGTGIGDDIDTSYWRENKFSVGSKEQPLNIEAIKEYHGEGKFKRDLSTFYNANTGANTNEEIRNQYNSTEYDEHGRFDKLATENANARKAGWKGKDLSKMTPLELFEFRESEGGKYGDKDNRFVTNVKQTAASAGAEIASLSMLPADVTKMLFNATEDASDKIVSMLPEEYRKRYKKEPPKSEEEKKADEEANMKKLQLKGYGVLDAINILRDKEVWNDMLGTDKRHLDKAMHEAERGINDALKAKTGMDVLKGITSAIVEAGKNTDLLLTDNAAQSYMLAKKAPMAIAAVSSDVQRQIREYKEKNGEEPSGKTVAGMYATTTVTLGFERILMKGPFDRLKKAAGFKVDKAGTAVGSAAAKAGRTVLEKVIGKKVKNVGEEAVGKMAKIKKGAKKVAGIGGAVLVSAGGEAIQETSQEASETWWRDKELLGLKEGLVAGTMGFGAGGGARLATETLTKGASAVMSGTKALNKHADETNTVKAAKGIGKNASASVVKNTLSQYDQEINQTNHLTERLDGLLQKLDKKEDLTDTEKKEFGKVDWENEDHIKGLKKEISEKIKQSKQKVENLSELQKNVSSEFDKRTETRNSREKFDVDKDIVTLNDQATFTAEEGKSNIGSTLDRVSESRSRPNETMETLSSYSSTELNAIKNHREVTPQLEKLVDRVIKARNKQNARVNVTDSTTNINQQESLDNQGKMPETSSSVMGFINHAASMNKIKTQEEAQAVNDAIDIAEDKGFISKDQAEAYKGRIKSNSRNAIPRKDIAVDENADTDNEVKPNPTTWMNKEDFKKENKSAHDEHTAFIETLRKKEKDGIELTKEENDSVKQSLSDFMRINNQGIEYDKDESGVIFNYKKDKVKTKTEENKEPKSKTETKKTPEPKETTESTETEQETDTKTETKSEDDVLGSETEIDAETKTETDEYIDISGMNKSEIDKVLHEQTNKKVELHKKMKSLDVKSEEYIKLKKEQDAIDKKMRKIVEDSKNVETETETDFEPTKEDDIAADKLVEDMKKNSPESVHTENDTILEEHEDIFVAKDTNDRSIVTGVLNIFKKMC